MKADIDLLKPKRNLIDLSAHSTNEFGFDDFIFSRVFGDIILVEYVDMSEDGDSIKRGNIFVPVNTITKAWRRGRVLLVGDEVEYVKEGDVVVFPHSYGVPVSGLPLEDGRKIKHGCFINEARLFGIASDPNENK